MAEAFTAQVTACIPSLRRYARGLTGDRDLADDLVQDTLERALSARWRWQRPGSLRAWMFSIMHNLFVDQVRARRRQAELDTGGDLPEGWVRPTQSDALELRDLDALLGRLGAELRAVILLVAVESFSYKDAARVLDVPVGTVMSRLSRARQRLAALMDEAPAASRVAAPSAAPVLQRVK